MTPNRTSRLAPVLAVAGCLVGLLVAGYVGGYFWLGQQRSTNDCRDVVRDCPTRWLRTIFRPAAMTEAKLTGRTVNLIAPPRGTIVDQEQYHP